MRKSHGTQRPPEPFSLTDFGDRLSKKMEAAGYSSADGVASALHVERTTVYRWKNGSTAPDYATLIALAHLLDTSCEYLLTGIDVQHSDAAKRYGLSNEALKSLETLSQQRVVYPPAGPNKLPKVKPADLLSALLTVSPPVDWGKAVDELNGTVTAENRANIIKQAKESHARHNWVAEIAERALMLSEQIKAYKPRKSRYLKAVEGDHDLDTKRNNLETQHTQFLNATKVLAGFGCYPLSERDYFTLQKQQIRDELVRLVDATLRQLWVASEHPEKEQK